MGLSPSACSASRPNARRDTRDDAHDDARATTPARRRPQHLVQPARTPSVLFSLVNVVLYSAIPHLRCGLQDNGVRPWSVLGGGGQHPLALQVPLCVPFRTAGAPRWPPSPRPGRAFSLTLTFDVLLLREASCPGCGR